MRKLFIVKALLALVLSVVACTFAGCSVETDGDLTSLTKPYAGLYECKVLRFGDTDYAEKFSCTLELKHDGTYTASYSTLSGGEGAVTGKYTVDEERSTITFYARVRYMERAFEGTMSEGKIALSYNIAGKQLYCEFED